MRKKQSSKVEKEDKQYRKRVECAKSLEGQSIWMKVEDMEQSIVGKNEQETVQYILNQLHYHQHVLKSKEKGALFNKSSKGKAFSSVELKCNMTTVLELNAIPEFPSEAGTEAAPPDEMALKYAELMNKLIERRRKDREGRRINKEKTKLERYQGSPISLVGKRTQHQCKDDDGEVEWFAAVVRDMVEERPDVMKVEYNIIYDDYLDEV